MIKTSLFADQEREAKLDKLGDALQVIKRLGNDHARALLSTFKRLAH